jgi:hypothetical protein
VGEQNRLRLLQVGITWHDCVSVPTSKLGQFFLKPGDQEPDAVEFLPQIHTNIQDNLVIPTSGRVEFSACPSDLFCQLTLDRHVDVFIGIGEFDSPTLHIVANFA